MTKMTLLLLATIALSACATEVKTVTDQDGTQRTVKVMSFGKKNCKGDDKKQCAEQEKTTAGQRMDKQLSKDAKKLKNFFGIKGKSSPAPKSVKQDAKDETSNVK